MVSLAVSAVVLTKYTRTQRITPHLFTASTRPTINNGWRDKGYVLPLAAPSVITSQLATGSLAGAAGRGAARCSTGWAADSPRSQQPPAAETFVGSYKRWRVTNGFERHSIIGRWEFEM